MKIKLHSVQLPVIAALSLALLAGIGSILAAQETEFDKFEIGNSELRPLKSEINGQNYLIYVAYPYTYDSEPDTDFPVHYQLDGYWDFALISAFYGNLIYDKDVPQFLLVGIGYEGENLNYGDLRMVDLAPTPGEGADRGAGGGPKFLEVLEKEIIPFIESEYRVDKSYRVLGGSSLGGLYSLYVMLEKQDLFNAYISASPAVGWDDDLLFKMASDLRAKQDDLPVRLWMSGATLEWPEFYGHIVRYNNHLQNLGFEDFEYVYRDVDGMKHAGTKGESYARGLIHAFAPYLEAQNEEKTATGEED